MNEYVNGLYETHHPKPTPQTIVFGQEENPIVKQEKLKAKYRYLLQSTVPFNWIPFVPQRLRKDQIDNNPFLLGGREMILRRGKMPCYLWSENDGKIKVDKVAVRPSSSILRDGITQQQGKCNETPLFFNEEAIQATGIRLVKNYQRARWLNGATYNWLGLYKRLAKTEATSGLEFDVLKNNE